jgi:hypothetical protein
MGSRTRKAMQKHSMIELRCAPLFSLLFAVGTALCLAISTALWAASDEDFPSQSRDESNASEPWLASGGRTSLRFDPGLLENLGWTVVGSEAPAVPDQPRDHTLDIAADSELEFLAPRGAFDGFAGGSLQAQGSLQINHRKGHIELSGFSLVPIAGNVLELRDATGRPRFFLDFMHIEIFPETSLLTMANMDVRISTELAQDLGYPELEGLTVGQAFISAAIRPASGAGQAGDLDEVLGGGCSAPNWHNGTTFVTDVSLINISSVQQVAREAGVRVAIAPSATLRNDGTADVPWYGKFHTEPGETYPQPYNRDQHPFLVWALYREKDGVFEQLASSGLKHAFFSQNGNCGCTSSNILWAAGNSANGNACTDLYSASTNDDPTRLGTREEVPASTGAWEQCGSMFAPAGTPPGPCTQTVSGATSDEFERRLVVAESELGVSGASYMLDAWYVVRDDINIFNSMARVPITPILSSIWTFTRGAVANGPAINAWVAPDTSTASAAHVRSDTGSGEYSVAVKVQELGGGNRRFVYVLMNYDFDARFDRFAVPVPAGVNVTAFGFADPDSNEGNNWTVSINAGQLAWTAPSGGELGWGQMNTFYFDTDAEPVESTVLVNPGNSTTDFELVILGLAPSDVVHEDGFETTGPP